ncbi:MAG: ATP-binding protein [Verrucomicrobiales bacterium]
MHARAQIDADAIEQILGNLIGNAEKYAARGEIRVRAQQDGDTLVLRVEDDGPGIPPDKAEAIFLPFERLSDQVTEGVSGAGIGLPIARELARLHGGDLRLVPGKSGAIFEAKLHAPLA